MAEFSSITTITRELQGLTLTGVKRVDNQPLGKGSYGQVFAVKHGRETYAAKQIHPILVEAVSPEEKRVVRDSFLKECHHCKNLNHPNIVRFIGVYYPDPHSTLPVMVMELMDTSLTDYVKTLNISIKLKISILHDISQGLKFLHCRISPIIHRDLSPNNILLSQDSVAKISDLGVAKVVKAGTKSTQSKLTKAPGTTDFMPPEALADNPTYSTGLDIFSYGGVILHVVNQEWPTPTNLIEFDSKMKPVKMLTEVERRQRYLAMMTGEAKRLKSLVIRCLDNYPANRPAATNVLEELKELKAKHSMPESLLSEPKGLLSAAIPFCIEVVNSVVYTVQQECKVVNMNVESSDSSISLGNTTMAISDTFMLLVDLIGFKSSKSWLPRGPVEERVHRGTLLVGLSEAEAKETKQYCNPTLNYKILSSEHLIQLFCKPEEVYPLTLHQKGLLIGIKSPYDRYRMAKSLQWAEKLTLGDGVHVNINGIPSPIKVTIRYIGSLPEEDGTKFGVEMLEKRGQGTSDGTFKGNFYFKSDRDCGLFVSLDKLVSPLAENQNLPPPMLDGQLKLGDRVTLFNEKEKELIGTVRWFGGCRSTKSMYKVVGIETDEKAFPRTIPGSFLGLNHFFIPKFSAVHQVFLSNDMILKTTNTSNAANQSTPWSQSSSVDPEVTIGTKLVIGASKKREVEERQRRQQKAQEELNLKDISGIDVTMLDEEKQRRLYEEAQLKNKKQNIDQVGGDHHAYGSQGNFSQTGGNNPWLDAAPGGNFRQQQSQHYAKSHEQGYLVATFHHEYQGNPDRWHPMANQSSVVENYNVPATRPVFQEQRPPVQPPISQYPSQVYRSQGYQPPVCQPQLQSCTQQIAHIPSAGGATQHDNYQGHTYQRPKVYHNYDEIPGKPYQADQLNQQNQYLDPVEYPANYNPNNFEVGSMIQYGNPPRYGMIKWIGHLPRAVSLVAGVEMEDPITGNTDGYWEGLKYFDSQSGRGVFQPIALLKPDSRFAAIEISNPLKGFAYEHHSRGETVQCAIALDESKHIGKPKGIQGHRDSCYLDATVYGMFAFTDVFDKLFLKASPKGSHDHEVRNILVQKIVNPLRLKTVVVYDAIMSLRTALDNLALNVKGLTSDKKDPEEFLNLLFKHVLFVDPFLYIRRPSGTDKEFFVQLFVEADKNVTMPTTELLLLKMFKSQKITFEKIPTRLLLQVPRYGKQFKLFDGIIPCLELDITDLCEGHAVKLCDVCGQSIGSLMCGNCQMDFCQSCIKTWHSHPKRCDQPHNIQDTSIKLKLLSVICIETSHYVCFTRVTGSEKDQWVFFDSMAERQDDLYNIPEVRLCTKEVEEHIYKNEDLVATPLNKLPELARRFVRDAYLCIYADPQQVMYDDDDSFM